MRIKFLSLAAVALSLVAATMSSCSDKEENYYINLNKDQVDSLVQIKLGYRMAPKPMIGSRAADADNSAITDPTLLPGNIGVWFQPVGDNLAWTDFFKGMYTFAPTETAGELTIVSTDKPFFPATTDGSVKIGAWYPVSAGDVTGLEGSTGLFTVKNDQTKAEDYAASDLMYGAPESGVDYAVSPTKEAIPLVFTHQLSKITVKLVDGTGVKASMLENPTIVMNNVATSTGIDIVKQTISSTADASGIDDVTITKGITDSKNSYSAIIPQQNIAQGSTFLTLTLKTGKQYTYALPAALDLVSGTHYTFTITVYTYNTNPDDPDYNEDGIKVSYTITPWTDGGNTDINL